eukprot:TRINITY_DN2406_c0_g2_i1.p1 TRINITY_DN2406_c0_g2~~TRINITY_DN2406_c0_g2_i1.p1  ORF type:complete len:641 (-),score=181.39 TRINITY_DN2406_c0_g2_i1:46-1968(-)
MAPATVAVGIHAMVCRLVPLHSSSEPPFPLPQEGGVIAIGRRPINTIVCKDISVSGKHCEIHCPGKSALPHVVDCSSNGTYVNDERVAKGEQKALHVGDVVSLTKPHPAGAVDGTVEPPPPRVQFRLEFKLAADSPAEGTPDDAASHVLARAASPSPTPSSLPPAALRRGATTAEGFAQDLLVQEQQCKAKITGELLLARRRLDEERIKSESLAKDLKKTKAMLDEECTRRMVAQETREQSRAEVAKLKEGMRSLQELRSSQAALEEKHERAEIELTTQVQKASSLEAAVAHLREELRQVEVSSSTAENLAAAQEGLRTAQDEAGRLEALASEARASWGEALKEAERLQREVAAERSKKERLEDQQALMAGEVERAERGGSSARDLLVQANKEIEALELRVARSRKEAEAERSASGKSRAEHEAALQRVEQLRDASVRFADALRSCTERWAQALPEASMQELPSAAAPKQVPAAQTDVEAPSKVSTVMVLEGQGTARPSRGAAIARPAPAADAAGGEEAIARDVPGEDAVGLEATVISQPMVAQEATSATAGELVQVSPQPEVSTQPRPQDTLKGPLASSSPSPAVAEVAAEAPKRLWSLAVLGGTAGEMAESLPESECASQDASPLAKSRRTSTASTAE